jgi:hypothetical protein
MDEESRSGQGDRLRLEARTESRRDPKGNLVVASSLHREDGKSLDLGEVTYILGQIPVESYLRYLSEHQVSPFSTRNLTELVRSRAIPVPDIPLPPGNGLSHEDFFIGSITFDRLQGPDGEYHDQERITWRPPSR